MKSDLWDLLTNQSRPLTCSAWLMCQLDIASRQVLPKNMHSTSWTIRYWCWKLRGLSSNMALSISIGFAFSGFKGNVLMDKACQHIWCAYYPCSHLKWTLLAAQRGKDPVQPAQSAQFSYWSTEIQIYLSRISGSPFVHAILPSTRLWRLEALATLCIIDNNFSGIDCKNEVPPTC